METITKNLSKEIKLIVKVKEKQLKVRNQIKFNSK